MDPRKLQQIIAIIARREPFIAACCNRFSNNFETLPAAVVRRRIRFLLGYSSLPTIVHLHKKGLLTKDMIIFIGHCLKKRKQQKRQSVARLMFEYNCYQGKKWNFLFLVFKACLNNILAFNDMLKDNWDDIFLSIPSPDRCNENPGPSSRNENEKNEISQTPSERIVDQVPEISNTLDNQSKNSTGKWIKMIKL